MVFIINNFNTILNYVCFWNFIRFLMKSVFIFNKTAFYTAVEKGIPQASGKLSPGR